MEIAASLDELGRRVRGLAHELGHARLHAHLLRAGEWEANWEDEATLYARVFLVPRPLLMNYRQTRELLRASQAGQGDLWEWVLDLADIFQVSGKFMVHTLDAYGLVRFDPATRWIHPGEGLSAGAA